MLYSIYRIRYIIYVILYMSYHMVCHISFVIFMLYVIRPNITHIDRSHMSYIVICYMLCFIKCDIAINSHKWETRIFFFQSDNSFDPENNVKDKFSMEELPMDQQLHRT